MAAKKHWFPFTAEQSVNILGEFGPLMTMFIVNALYDIDTGVKALIATTVMAMVVMLIVLRRLPVFPLIAGTVTVVFGWLTLVTGDPMWVQIKVTIFNLLFALVLWAGLWMGKNFFHYVFGKTFHYTPEGWRKFTNSFAWFFVFTAVINEAVRLGFDGVEIEAFDKTFDGVQIWIFFKLFVVMPFSGMFAWWQTKLMHKYRLPDSEAAGAFAPVASDRDGHHAGLGAAQAAAMATTAGGTLPTSPASAARPT